LVITLVSCDEETMTISSEEHVNTQIAVYPICEDQVICYLHDFRASISCIQATELQMSKYCYIIRQ
jgi:hypothetical protein